jgi:hypothetical protein
MVGINASCMKTYEDILHDCDILTYMQAVQTCGVLSELKGTVSGQLTARVNNSSKAAYKLT